MTRVQPFDAVKHLDNPEVIRTYVEETRAEIERLQADIDKLLAERQGWLDEIERLRAQLACYEPLRMDTLRGLKP